MRSGSGGRSACPSARPVGDTPSGTGFSRPGFAVGGAGDHKGRPYGRTRTGATVGDGLVPSRLCRRWRGRPQGSPLRADANGRDRRGRACPVPVVPSVARATTRVAPAGRRRMARGTGLSRPGCPVGGAGDHKGRPYGRTRTGATVGDGLVPSRLCRRWRGRPQGSPLRTRMGPAVGDGLVPSRRRSG